MSSCLYTAIMSQVTVQHVNMDKVSCMLFKFTQFLYKAKSATVEKVGMMAELQGFITTVFLLNKVLMTAAIQGIISALRHYLFSMFPYVFMFVHSDNVTSHSSTCKYG